MNDPTTSSAPTGMAREFDAQSIARPLVEVLATSPGFRQHADETVIPKQWTFKDRSVADNFDRHVREQLPWYDLVTQMVTHIGRHYLPERGMMYDLGASTGNITKALGPEILSRQVMAISVDNSPQMADVWRGVGEFVIADVRKYELQDYDFCTCFLLLMFLPPRDQEQVFRMLLSRLKKGGALLVFDKVETADGYLGTVLHRLTMAGKVSSGVPAEEIIRKELSLAGVQRPLPATFMNSSGAQVEQVFRFGEFAGWVIVR